MTVPGLTWYLPIVILSVRIRHGYRQQRPKPEIYCSSKILRLAGRSSPAQCCQSSELLLLLLCDSLLLRSPYGPIWLPKPQQSHPAFKLQEERRDKEKEDKEHPPTSRLFIKVPEICYFSLARTWAHGLDTIVISRLLILEKEQKGGHTL